MSLLIVDDGNVPRSFSHRSQVSFFLQTYTAVTETLVVITREATSALSGLEVEQQVIIVAQVETQCRHLANTVTSFSTGAAA